MTTIDELIEKLNGRAGALVYPASLCREAASALSTLQEQKRKLEEALKPFADFADAWDGMPISGIHDDLYGIHAGSEHEGWLRLSDCRRARALLSGGGEG